MAKKKTKKKQSRVPKLILAGALATGCLATFYFFNHGHNNTINYSTAQPYIPSEEQENPQVFVFSFKHAGTKKVGEDKKADEYLEDQIERFTATLKELHSKGVEDIVLEGLTLDMVDALRENPNVYSSFNDNQFNYFAKLFGYLNSTEWRTQGMESLELLPEVSRHISVLGEMQRRYKASHDERIKEEARNYLEGPEGDKFYEVDVIQREKLALQKVKTGRKTVLVIGNGHAEHVTEGLEKEKIPYALYADSTEQELKELGTRSGFIKHYMDIIFNN